MIRWLLLGLALGISAFGRADTGFGPVSGSPTAEASAAPTPLAWSESGIEFCLGATALSVFNGSPLSYTPFELGWRFANGLHLRSGLDIFYYEGADTDASLAQQGVRNYSYDMQDWRSTVLYVVPLPGHWRPMAGLSVEAVRGDRKLSDPGLLNSPKLAAWAFLGTGAVLGAQWRFSPDWALETQARYTFTFNSLGALTALGLNMAYLY